MDGADEVAFDLGLMKGRGAAMLREDLDAAASRRFVVVVQAQKRVGRLGQRQRLPVEVDGVVAAVAADAEQLERHGV